VALHQDLTALEVLGMAIKSEIEAATLYAYMAEQTRNTLLVKTLQFLNQEEEKHRILLEDMYRRQFPNVELHLPAQSPVPIVSATALASMELPEMFQLAMQAEQLSADFYSRETERAKDISSRTLLRYLSRVERSHYHILENEYELMSRFPSYYNAEDFHFGNEMMHVGP